MLDRYIETLFDAIVIGDLIECLSFTLFGALAVRNVQERKFVPSICSDRSCHARVHST